jgi:sarcosine oxidase
VSEYDVIVLGLGGMGSATARQLAARGARVLGLERFTPAHDLGASHGDSRIVRMAYFEKPDYVPLLRRAYELWDELGADVGHELFVRTGALMIGAADTAVVAGTVASVRQWDLPHEVLDHQAMAVRYPQFGLQAGEMAVYEEDAGYVNPEEVVRAHLKLAARDGAELRFEAQVTGWRADADAVVVALGEEEIRADKLVIAAGAWTPTMVPQLDVPMRVGRRVMHYMEPVVSVDDFAADRFPVYIFQTGPGDEIYGFPFIGSPSTGVKVGFHHRGPDVDPDEIDRVVSDLEEEEMRELLADRIPGIAGRHVQSKVCMYTLTPDEDFVIDQLPNSYGRVCVAAGFSGHGFKFTPVVGEILADLALTGETGHPIKFLAADRF